MKMKLIAAAATVVILGAALDHDRSAAAEREQAPKPFIHFVDGKVVYADSIPDCH